MLLPSLLLPPMLLLLRLPSLPRCCCLAAAASLLSVLLLQESVALVLKQPALIGLDTAELAARIQGLSEAVGCETAAAAKLAGAHSSLIMLHPDYVKVSQLDPHSMKHRSTGAVYAW